MSLIVTGTGTGVGKTLASAVILSRYAGRYRLAYWKPVATGSAEGRDSDFVRRTVGKEVEVLPETYLFDPPLSPHLAARLARQPIEPERLVEAFVAHALSDDERNLVVEGIGGLLVPLTDGGHLLANLFMDLSLPCVIVASSQLGTINHTLLTLEAARSRKLEVAGVILSGPLNRENRLAIERFGSVEVLAEIPRIAPLTRAGIRRTARSFDRKGRLGKFFE